MQKLFNNSILELMSFPFPVLMQMMNERLRIEQDLLKEQEKSLKDNDSDSKKPVRSTLMGLAKS